MASTSSSRTFADSDADFIRDVYIALLDREPDAFVQKTLLDALSDGQFDRRHVIRQIIESQEYSKRYHSVGAEFLEPHGCTREEAKEVFGHFTRYDGPGRPGYVTNFMGGVSETAVSNLLTGLSGCVEGFPFPGNFHGETLEWIGTLRAALESRDVFAMIELGAGWGPWCVIGAMAAKQKGITNVRVVGIEADAGHVDFMRRNFVANGLTCDEVEVLHGAIGIESGTAHFPTARNADQVYGGAAAYSDDDREAGPFADFMRGSSGLVEAVEPVPCFALSDLLNKFAHIDLVHCDIQGTELDLIPRAIDVLTAKVKRLIVGTHSFQIDRTLSGVMGSRGWICEGMSACTMQSGRCTRDGMQVWVNPNLR